MEIIKCLAIFAHLVPNFSVWGVTLVIKKSMSIRCKRIFAVFAYFIVVKVYCLRIHVAAHYIF